MTLHDPPTRHRIGAIAEVERDGSVTLYGIEDWIQISVKPTIKIATVRPGPSRRPRPTTAAPGSSPPLAEGPT